MQIEQFNPMGGVYSETVAVCNVLAHIGLHAPHTGKPFREALLFGISGGVGFSYFTFEYEGHTPSLYLGMANRYKTRYGEYMNPLFERLGVQAQVRTTSSAKRAQTALIEDLSQGKPVILHVDRGRLAYLALDQPDADHALVVYGFDEQTANVQVADLSRVPLSLSALSLSRARGSFRPLNNRSTTLGMPLQPIDLDACLRAGILACSERMLNPPKPVNNFGIPGMRKWAQRVHDPKDGKGWPKVFNRPGTLFDALCGAFAWIETRETGGAGLRDLYAVFLEQAGEALKDEVVRGSAQAFRAVAQDWRKVAETLLSDSIPGLARAKALLRQREQRFLESGAAAVGELQELDAQLQLLRAQAEDWFPERLAVLDAVHAALSPLIEREEAAHAALQAHFLLDA